MQIDQWLQRTNPCSPCIVLDLLEGPLIGDGTHHQVTVKELIHYDTEGKYVDLVRGEAKYCISHQRMCIYPFIATNPGIYLKALPAGKEEE